MSVARSVHRLSSAIGFIARRLRGSNGIAIRAIRPDDRERIVTAFQGLDQQSIYQRFFFPKRELSGEELRQLTECEGVRDVVLVATVGSGDREIVIGLGRYARNGASAQIAFTVVQEYRGRGIATEMLRQLADIARRNDVLQFEADVLAGNRSMLHVFHHSGLPIQESEADGFVHVTMLLGDGGRERSASLRGLR